MSFLSATPILAASGAHGALRDLLNNPTVMMLGVWGLIAFIFIIIPLWLALFVHITTRWFGMNQSFGTAFLTVILDMVLVATFNVGLALFGVSHIDAAGWAANLAASMIAVSIMYKSGFFKSLAITVMSNFLTGVVTLLMIFGLVAIIGSSAPKGNQPAPNVNIQTGTESVKF